MGQIYTLAAWTDTPPKTPFGPCTLLPPSRSHPCPECQFPRSSNPRNHLLWIWDGPRIRRDGRASSSSFLLLIFLVLCRTFFGLWDGAYWFCFEMFGSLMNTLEHFWSLANWLWMWVGVQLQCDPSYYLSWQMMVKFPLIDGVTRALPPMPLLINVHT